MNTPTATCNPCSHFIHGQVPTTTDCPHCKVEALTTERDAYIAEAARVDTGWRKANEVALETNRKNAALRDAARLALDALYAYEPCIKKFGLLFGTGNKAIAALKAVL